MKKSVAAYVLLNNRRLRLAREIDMFLERHPSGDIDFFIGNARDGGSQVGISCNTTQILPTRVLLDMSKCVVRKHMQRVYPYKPNLLQKVRGVRRPEKMLAIRKAIWHSLLDAFGVCIQGE